ncbi:Uncharacterised protein [Chlamydia trachomatis]|nr:Uncharacterised protein [Chlamydia trachomatis]
MGGFLLADTGRHRSTRFDRATGSKRLCRDRRAGRLLWSDVDYDRPAEGCKEASGDSARHAGAIRREWDPDRGRGAVVYRCFA